MTRKLTLLSSTFAIGAALVFAGGELATDLPNEGAFSVTGKAAGSF